MHISILIFFYVIDKNKKYLSLSSTLTNEGKNLLIEEFGRDYLTYFTILELIFRGKTARSEIESLLSKDIGGYLQRLEIDYATITKHRPINAKPNTRNQKYKIIDNFLNFWFHFIYHYRTAIELENYNFVKTMIKQNYTTYAGRILEYFFKQLLIVIIIVFKINYFSSHKSASYIKNRFLTKNLIYNNLS